MKVKYRVLSVILSFMMFFMVGCTETINPDLPYVIQGAKVLRKPSDYEISDLVDGNSEYFYNLFAGNVMTQLYEVYSNLSDFVDSSNIDSSEENSQSILTNTNLANYSEENKKYINDSIRYNIESISTITNDDGTSATIVINFDGWDFSFENYVPSNSGTLLEAWAYLYSLALINNNNLYDDNISTYTYNELENKLTITIPTSAFENFYNSVTDIFGSPKDYSSYYYGTEITFEDDANKTLYFSSPYYQQYVAGESVTAVNDYQDALEYAVYLFVLGYDYENADGTENTEDAPYFDFDIIPEQTTESGFTINVPKVYVNGWEDEAIPVAEALQQVKDLYADLGVYIGVSGTNKEQIKRFILDKVIGVPKDSGGNYDSSFEIQIVNTTNNSTDRSTMEMDRCYEQVVTNIIEYACDQVLIGGADGDGEVNIDEPFPISEIVDYQGDTFLVRRKDESSVNENGDLSLDHVPEAQYQCISLELRPEDVGENVSLKEISLSLQYYDTGTTDRSLQYLDEIVINVGINYFDSSTNTLYQYEPTRKVIEYSEAITTRDDPDKNLVLFTDFEYASDYEGLVGIEPIPAKMSFDNNIDNGVLNASVNGEPVEDGVNVIKIDGSSPARRYYRMNDSSSYGQYATFNPDMFAGKTDYIEIYFDVEKVKGLENINYNFKVGINWIATDAYQQ